MHSPGPAHPAPSRCHGRPTPFPRHRRASGQITELRPKRPGAIRNESTHLPPTNKPATHPVFHKLISPHPTQPNPQIDSTTPVAEEANDSMNTAIGTHSHSNPLQGSRWFQTSYCDSTCWSLEFQSASRFAVVSDLKVTSALLFVTGGFNPLRGSRWFQTGDSVVWGSRKYGFNPL